MTLADIDTQAFINAAKAQPTGTVAFEDLPIVPLWMLRPSSGEHGSSAAAEHSMKPNPGAGAGSAAAADRYITDAPKNLADPGAAVTTSVAEGHWMDMSDEDRMAFAAEAEKSGMWSRKQGGDALFGAWVKAVSWAGKYNSLHQTNERQWISPFEAVTKMQIAGMADDNLDHDGFSTQTSVQQFTDAQVRGNARQILQDELGRNPTDSEMRAYTAAINAAALANPQTMTTQRVDNPDGSTSSSSVSTGGIDPNEIIRGMTENTDEADAYATAAQYLPALQQAIGAFTHL